MPRGYPAETVEDYLAAIPAAERAALAPLRDVILAAIPDPGEHIGYQIPIFDYRGRGLIGLSVAAKHCALHLMSPPLAKALVAEAGGTRIDTGKVSGATIQFPADNPLSAETVRMIVARRIAEVDARRA